VRVELTEEVAMAAVVSSIPVTPVAASNSCVDQRQGGCKGHRMSAVWGKILVRGTRVSSATITL
jgi:hypothetical protein